MHNGRIQCLPSLYIEKSTNKKKSEKNRLAVELKQIFHYSTILLHSSPLRDVLELDFILILFILLAHLHNYIHLITIQIASNRL